MVPIGRLVTCWGVLAAKVAPKGHEAFTFEVTVYRLLVNRKDVLSVMARKSLFCVDIATENIST